MDKWPKIIELCVFNGPEILTLQREHGPILAYYLTGDKQIILVKRDAQGNISEAD